MADRRDRDEIKLTDEDMLDIEIRDDELDDLDLSNDDLSRDDILDDDFTEPSPRPKKKGGISLATIVLSLAVLVVGGGLWLMNNQSLRQGQLEAVAKQEPLPLLSTTPEAVAMSNPESGVADIPTHFSDLPQPDAVPVVEPVAAAVPPTTIITPNDQPNTAVVNTVENNDSSSGVEGASSTDTKPSPQIAEIAAGEKPIDVPNPSQDTLIKDAAGEDTKQPTVSTIESSEPKPMAEVKTVETKLATVKPQAKPQAPAVDTMVADEDQVVEAVKKSVADQSHSDVPSSVPSEGFQNLIIDETATPPSDVDLSSATVDASDENTFHDQPETVQALGKRGEPRFVVPPGQEDRHLEVTVDSPSTPNVKRETISETRIAEASRALDLERYQASFDIFNELYATNKRDERVLMGRAVSLQKLGRNEEAIKAYDELLALNPTSPEVMTNMLGLVRKQYPTASLERLLELRQRYPNNAVVAAQTGLANAGVGNFEEALRYLTIAAAIEPNNPKHPFNMAVISERMGKADVAVSYYEQALKSDALSNIAQNRIDRDLVYDRLALLRP